LRRKEIEEEGGSLRGNGKFLEEKQAKAHESSGEIPNDRYGGSKGGVNARRDEVLHRAAAITEKNVPEIRQGHGEIHAVERHSQGLGTPTATRHPRRLIVVRRRERPRPQEDARDEYQNASDMNGVVRFVQVAAWVTLGDSLGPPMAVNKYCDALKQPQASGPGR